MAPKRDVFAELLGLKPRTPVSANTGDTGGTGDTANTANTAGTANTIDNSSITANPHTLISTESVTPQDNKYLKVTEDQLTKIGGTGTGDTGITFGGTGDIGPSSVEQSRSDQRSPRSTKKDRSIEKAEPNPSSFNQKRSDLSDLDRREEIPDQSRDTGGTGVTGDGAGTSFVSPTTNTSMEKWRQIQPQSAEQRFAPREVAVLRVADSRASLDTGEFWCKSTEFMSLARLVNRNYFFEAIKRLENRRILQVLVKYNGCRDGVKYRLDRSMIPGDIWELLNKTSSGGTGGTGNTGSTGKTGATGITGVTALDHDHDLGSDQREIDLIRSANKPEYEKRIEERDSLLVSGAPTEIVQEFITLTGQRWQPKFDLLWQELAKKAQEAQITFNLIEIVKTMRRATQDATSRPKSFKYFTVSLEREWGLQRKLAAALWTDILRQSETDQNLSDYSSRVEALKCKFTELGIAWDNDLIQDVITKKRA